MSRKALGRGLRALIPETEGAQGAVRTIPLDLIDNNPDQPRKRFDEEQLEELKASILAHGLLEPIIVRPIDGRYEVVVGERRWRAAQMAGLKEIPAIVRSMSEREAMVIALVENVQREDLNPLEEAEAYKRLMEEFQLTQEEIAERVGKKRSTIANRLRLLELDPEIREDLAAGRISGGHAKALLGIPVKAKRLRIARRIVEEGLSVRAVEELAREEPQKRETGARKRAREERVDDPIVRDVEERLQQSLGTKVRVVRNGRRGRIEIDYYSEDEMHRIVEVLLGGE